LAELQPDLVLFDRFMMEEQFAWRVEKCCPAALRILDSEDLHFLRDARQQALKQQRSLIPTDYLDADLTKREIAAIYRCDMTLVISPFEMEFLQREFSIAAELLCYCPFMEEIDNLHAPDNFTERQHCISIGNFRHAPNWDAVLELKRLWPQIRQRLPGIELHIYGAYPPPKATQLHNPKEGFLIKGWAQDARQVLRSARVLLAPLRFGAGIKGKFADAMACGTPAVTTTLGAEGMQGDAANPLPWPGCIADTDAEFIAAVCALYADEQAWCNARQQGLANLTALYAAAPHRAYLYTRLTELRAQLDAKRTRNFIGAMLRHHSLKSTQYMAQWIEAKNKLR
jgi:O-antigen biosynthesis protein